MDFGLSWTGSHPHSASRSSRQHVIGSDSLRCEISKACLDCAPGWCDCMVSLGRGVDGRSQAPSRNLGACRRDTCAEKGNMKKVFGDVVTQS